MIAVEVMPDAGAPQVGITVSGLGAGSAVISVEVSWDDGYSWHGVRGVQRVTVAGGSDFFRDFVPPLNVDAIYRLVVHSGTASAAGEATILVPSDVGWIQDPLNPRAAVPVSGVRGTDALSLMSGTAAAVARRQAFDAALVEGSRHPVASVGARQAPANVPVLLRAVLADQGGFARSLRRLFDEAGTVVLRGLPNDLPLDAVAHVVAGDVVEVPTPGGVLGVRNDWQLDVTQVRPTSMRLAVPFWTYEQVTALWQEALGAGVTYADVEAARPGDTHLSWARSPEAS